MDSGNMGDPDLTGHTDHGTTDHTGQTDQAITQVASEESGVCSSGGGGERERGQKGAFLLICVPHGEEKGCS